MASSDARLAAAGALLLALAACGGDRGEAPSTDGGVEADSTPTPRGAGAVVPGITDDGFSAVLGRVAERTYTMEGETPVPALELTVEDGHNVLYGPAPVEVRDGRFSTLFQVGETDRPQVYAYLTDPSGERQWVVPIPLDRAQVRYPSAELADSAAGR